MSRFLWFTVYIDNVERRSMFSTVSGVRLGIFIAVKHSLQCTSPLKPHHTQLNNDLAFK